MILHVFSINSWYLVFLVLIIINNEANSLCINELVYEDVLGQWPVLVMAHIRVFTRSGSEPVDIRVSRELRDITVRLSSAWLSVLANELIAWLQLYVYNLQNNIEGCLLGFLFDVKLTTCYFLSFYKTRYNQILYLELNKVSINNSKNIRIKFYNLLLIIYQLLNLYKNQLDNLCTSWRSKSHLIKLKFSLRYGKMFICIM